MLKMACANCGAPLEVSPRLDVFSCGYCGSQQKVERHGGTVSLHTVEESLQAVRRSGDRTAAELAFPRLKAEVAEAESQVEQSLKLERMEKILAVKRRKHKTVVSMIAVGFLTAFLIIPSPTRPAFVGVILSCIWIAICVLTGRLVWKRSKMPTDELARKRAAWEERLASLRKQLTATRAVLDQAH